MGADKSKYDQLPLDPNAQGGGGDSTPMSFSGNVPDVQVLWSSLPAVVADGSAGSDQSTTPPLHSAVRVDIGGVRNAERGMLNAGAVMADSYETLKNLTMSNQNVFGQDATMIPPAPTGLEYASYDDTPVASPIQETAKQFAAAILPAEETVLTRVADTLELLGQFIAAMNSAATTYATADYKSRFPEPGA
ncbi:hypothetical protein [Streptomyces prunicolor]|uniref:hypothetical protein n=1 Tax=Streptomyces prunicolor TaxID=67348 RepID=UPI0033D37F7C